MDAQALDPVGTVEAAIQPAVTWWRRKAIVAIVLIASFLATATILIFVISPSAGAAGSCGGG